MKAVSGNIVDITNRTISPGKVIIDNGRILSVETDGLAFEFTSLWE